VAQSENQLKLGAEGDNALVLVQSMLNNIKLNNDIVGATVTLQSKSEFEYTPNINSDETLVDDEVSDGEEKHISENDQQSVDTTDGTDDGKTSESTDSDETESEVKQDAKTVSFQEDSGAKAVAKMLFDRRDEGFLDVTEIQQFTPDDAGIPKQQFSKILWDLADRGVVEKKNHPDDGRKKIYKLTTKGIASVRMMKAEEQAT